MIKNILKVVIRALVTKDRLHDKVTNLLSSILSDISIYDIGASYFYHKRFEVFYKSKNSVLHSIDPNSNNLLYLDNWKFKSIVKKFPYAVGGSNEERILNVTKIDSGSSLLNFDFNKNNDHRIVKENLLPIKQKKITVKSFKDLYRDTVREKDLVIFKIDTQGTELEILESIVQNDLKEKILCVEV
jgi:FkbM family methyltransferase